MVVIQGEANIMPKRVVIKSGGEEREKETPIIEPVEGEKPAEQVEAEKTIVVEPTISQEDKELQEAEVDAETAYETVKKKIEEVRIREKVTQQKFRDQEDMGISILKKLLQKWDALREEVVNSITTTIERYRRFKALLEVRFSKLEEELYFNQIELDTLRQLEEQGEPISVSKKEELEQKVPELMKELANVNKRMEEIDERIAELQRTADNIYEATAYKDIASTLFKEMVETFQDRLGEDAEAKLRIQVDAIAQREGIPREYATIYVWKRLKRM